MNNDQQKFIIDYINRFINKNYVTVQNCLAVQKMLTNHYDKSFLKKHKFNALLSRKEMQKRFSLSLELLLTNNVNNFKNSFIDVNFTKNVFICLNENRYTSNGGEIIKGFKAGLKEFADDLVKQ